MGKPSPRRFAFDDCDLDNWDMQFELNINLLSAAAYFKSWHTGFTNAVSREHFDMARFLLTLARPPAAMEEESDGNAGALPPIHRVGTPVGVFDGDRGARIPFVDSWSRSGVGKLGKLGKLDLYQHLLPLKLHFLPLKIPGPSQPRKTILVTWFGLEKWFFFFRPREARRRSLGLMSGVWGCGTGLTF